MQPSIPSLGPFQIEIASCFDLIPSLWKARVTFLDLKFAQEEKIDGSPVTAFDHLLNKIILENLQKNFVNDLVVSEESPLPTSSNQSRIWFVDPLDGTKDFIRGTNEWAIQIGLTINSQPVFGFVYMPDQHQLFFAAKDCGSFRQSCESGVVLGNAVSIHCQNKEDLESATLLVSASHTPREIFERAQKWKVAKLVPMGSLGVKLCRLAEGAADIYYLAGGRAKLWDVCAPEVIFSEAGGRFQYVDESSITYSMDQMRLEKKGVLAASPKLWEKIQKQFPPKS